MAEPSGRLFWHQEEGAPAGGTGSSQTSRGAEAAVKGAVMRTQWDCATNLPVEWSRVTPRGFFGVKLRL